jgi:hypothetical protein
MRRLFGLLLAAYSANWAADWVQFKSGPFEVLSRAGEQEGRKALNFLEQLRHALGVTLGQEELQPPWPVRVLVVPRNTTVYLEPKLGRDAYMLSMQEPAPVLAAAMTDLLIRTSPAYVPPHLHRGFVSLFSTLEVDGTRLTLGAPAQASDRDWARAHMLAVDPEFSGKVRVLLRNLGSGMERDIAYRNAFGREPDEVERSVDRYLKAGQFGTVAAPSRPINYRRDFRAREVEPLQAQLAEADLLLAHGRPEARAAYQAALKIAPESAEVTEGLGLLDLAAGQVEQARARLEKSTGARGLYELARLTKKPEYAAKSGKTNPKWAEPLKLSAELETHPAQQLASLRKAAELEPHNAKTWQALAELQEKNKQFVEAAKSWAAAERATDDPNERERLRQARLAGEEQRREAERAAREEQRRQSEAEMAALRNKALAAIREAEARANEGKPVIDASTLEEYKEGPDTKSLSGVLTRVECLGQNARLHVNAGKSATKLLVRDPGQVAISGGGQKMLGCGPQKPARKVTVEYMPKPDSQLGTTGEVTTITFK